MKFSTRTTYGLRAMIKLAESWPDKAVPLSLISRKEGISLKYLERIFARLRRAGLVKAEKGVRGGYHLSRRPELINVYEIVKALEGQLALFRCLDDDGRIDCGSVEPCPVSTVLAKVQIAIIKVLKSMVLSSLI